MSYIDEKLKWDGENKVSVFGYGKQTSTRELRWCLEETRTRRPTPRVRKEIAIACRSWRKWKNQNSVYLVAEVFHTWRKKWEKYLLLRLMEADYRRFTVPSFLRPGNTCWDLKRKQDWKINFSFSSLFRLLAKVFSCSVELQSYSDSTFNYIDTHSFGRFFEKGFLRSTRQLAALSSKQQSYRVVSIKFHFGVRMKSMNTT